MRGRWRWLWVLCLVGLGCAGPAKTTGVGLSSEAVALNDAGYQYWRQGKWNLAQDKFAQALKLNRLIDRQPGIAANLNNLGAIAQGQGDLKQAENYFREALAIHRQHGDTAGLAETLNNLGTVYQAQGRLNEAQGAYQEALSYAQLMPAGPLLALTLTHLGDVARAQGDYGGARDLYFQALALDEAQGDRRGQAVRWERLGRTALALKAYPQAGAYLNDALKEFRRLEDTDGIVDALNGLTKLALAQDDRQEALTHGERLIKIYQARGQTKEAEKLQVLLGEGAKGRRPLPPPPKPPPPIP